MNATGQAMEIFDVLAKKYGDEAFVGDGYGYYEDAVKLVAQALQEEQNKGYKFKTALEKIANDTPENTSYEDPYSEAQHYIDVAKLALESSRQ